MDAHINDAAKRAQLGEVLAGIRGGVYQRDVRTAEKREGVVIELDYFNQPAAGCNRSQSVASLILWWGGRDRSWLAMPNDM